MIRPALMLAVLMTTTTATAADPDDEHVLGPDSQRQEGSSRNLLHSFTFAPIIPTILLIRTWCDNSYAAERSGGRVAAHENVARHCGTRKCVA